MSQAAPRDYDILDSDQHYYEPHDAYTRHLDKKFKDAFRWVKTEEGHSHILMGGHRYSMIPNPTFDPVAKPGALLAYLKAQNSRGASGKEIAGELGPLLPEYVERAARLKAMESHGVKSALVLPTLPLGFEELLWDNPPALSALVQAGLKWLDEDWGFDRDGRLICAPMLCLVDAEAAERDLRFVIDRGGKAITLRPGPVRTPSGNRSPGDPAHDRFFSMAEEAGVVICLHASDSGYGRYAVDYGEKSFISTFAGSAFPEVLSLHLERPIYDTLAAYLCHGVFDRHPRLKVAAIELGAAWVPELLRRLKMAWGRVPYLFGKDPVEAFHENVWVTPFHEQSIPETLEHMRVERVLFGSDWPHPEGIVEPIDFLDELEGVAEEGKRLIMGENMRQMLGLP